MRLAVAVLTLAATIVAPAAAEAATATGRTVCAGRGEPLTCRMFATFRAAPGERNEVTVALRRDHVRFRDAANDLQAGKGCAQVDERTVECRAEGGDVLAAEVLAGDGDDRVAPDGAQVSQRLDLYGEDGDDELVGADADDWLDGGDGDDRLFGGFGPDQLFPGRGADVAEGGDGDDVVALGDVPAPPSVGSQFEGNPPRPEPLSGLGTPLPDRAEGGAGKDRVTYRGETRDLEVDLRARTTGGAAGGDVLTGFEDLTGGQGSDQLYGDDGPNEIGAAIDSTGSGDRIAGRGGDDTLGGSVSSDTLDGGPGDDAVSGVGLEPDLLFGGPGDDVIDSLAGGLVDAGDGDDVVRSDYETPRDPRRIRCGAGEDIAPGLLRTTLAPDCEWANLFATVKVRRRLVLSGRSAVLRQRGDRTPGRLVLRDHGTGRVLGSAASGRGRVRIPLRRADAGRIRSAGRLEVTVEHVPALPYGTIRLPRARATIVAP